MPKLKFLKLGEISSENSWIGGIQSRWMYSLWWSMIILELRIMIVGSRQCEGCSCAWLAEVWVRWRIDSVMCSWTTVKANGWYYFFFSKVEICWSWFEKKNKKSPTSPTLVGSKLWIGIFGYIRRLCSFGLCTPKIPSPFILFERLRVTSLGDLSGDSIVRKWGCEKYCMV